MRASPGLLAWVGTSKFVDGMPLNRIADVAEHRFGAPFNSTTLSTWMIKSGRILMADNGLILVAIDIRLHHID